jgi:hypothetical protein
MPAVGSAMPSLQVRDAVGPTLFESAKYHFAHQVGLMLTFHNVLQQGVQALEGDVLNPRLPITR